MATQIQRVLAVITVAILIFMSILFFFRGMIYLDPDFGWHIRMGQEILSKGVPKQDSLTYTMPSYKYVDHEWLTDVLIASLYPQIGYVGLSIIFTIMAVFSIVVVLQKRYWKYSGIPLLLVTPLLLPFFGIRPQIITWFFFSILVRFMFDRQIWIKYKYITPFLFLLWANMHGGFPIGLLLLGVITVDHLVEKKRPILIDWIILITSFLITLVNPYGLQLWISTINEGWILSTNQVLRYTIDEWTPLLTRFSPVLIVYLFVVIGLFFYRLKHWGLLKSFILISLLVAAFSSRRHLPLWILMSLPIFSESLQHVIEKVKTTSKTISTRQKLYLFGVICSVLLFAIQSKNVYTETYTMSEITHYPTGAVQFIDKITVSGNIFTSYGWGGYLEWKLPQYKQFIDGRMPSWKTDAALDNEASWAYLDHYKLSIGKGDIAREFDKYQVNAVIWPTILMNNTKVIDTIKQLDWKRIYSDPVAMIYIRPN